MNNLNDLKLAKKYFKKYKNIFVDILVIKPIDLSNLTVIKLLYTFNDTIKIFIMNNIKATRLVTFELNKEDSYFNLYNFLNKFNLDKINIKFCFCYISEKNNNKILLLKFS